MPKKPMLPCRHPGCPNLSEERYCPQHRTTAARTDKTRERDKDYNSFVRDKASQSFYESDAWRKLRKQQLGRQPLCEICLAEGRFNKATLVHHKHAIREGGNPLDIDGLQSLCWSCHSRIEKSNKKDK